MAESLVRRLCAVPCLAHAAGSTTCGADNPLHLGIVPVSTVCTSVYVPLNCPDTMEKLDASRLSARPWGLLSTFEAKIRVLHHGGRVQ